jgi:hypothetical protein
MLCNNTFQLVPCPQPSGLITGIPAQMTRSNSQLRPTSQEHLTLDTISAARAIISKPDYDNPALIASITRLPPEVLSSTFIQCNDTHPSNLYRIFRLDKAPLMLRTSAGDGGASLCLCWDYGRHLHSTLGQCAEQMTWY